MDARKFAGGKWFNAHDLDEGEEYPKVIEDVSTAVVTDNRGQQKEILVLHFKGGGKAFGLGTKANQNMVMHNLGSFDTDDWLGRKLVFYRTTTEMAGKIVACVRIRSKEELAARRASGSKKGSPDAEVETDVEPDFVDDDIPFIRNSTIYGDDLYPNKGHKEPWEI